MHHFFNRKTAPGRGWIIVLPLFIVIYLPHSAQCYTELTGSIGGMTLTAEEGPYIVIKDLLVPKGEKTVIKEGCQFFFNSFTGIIVHGDLTVAGTEKFPILFTSINDSLSPGKKDQLPNPFDWNGIHITEKAGKVTFSHFILSYSVYGIKSQNEAIVVENGIFLQNGQFHFTIMDAPMPVADVVAYSYAGNSIVYRSNGATSGKVPIDSGRYRKESVVRVAENRGDLKREGFSFTGWNSAADGNGSSYAEGANLIMGSSDITLYAEWHTIDGKDRIVSQQPARTIFVKKGVPAIIGGTGVVSGVIALVFLKEWLDLRDEYRTTLDSEQRDKLEGKGIQSSQIAGGAGTFSVAAIGTATMLYWLWNLREEKHTTIVPSILPAGAGIVMTIDIP